MEYWQKLLLDSAHHAVLKNLDQPKKKEEIAEKTGLKPARCQRTLQNLMQAEMIEYEIEEGVRTFNRSLTGEIEELKDKLRSETIGGVKEAVQEEDFEEARQHLTKTLPVEGETRGKVARLEAAEKLSELG